ncbi:MAG: hypothetical protein AABZ30_08055 [Myxococcota bacterium]
MAPEEHAGAARSTPLVVDAAHMVTVGCGDASTCLALEIQMM